MSFKQFVSEVNPLKHPPKLVKLLPNRSSKIPRHRNGRINWELVEPGTEFLWDYAGETHNVTFIRIDQVPHYIRVNCAYLGPRHDGWVATRSRLRAVG